MAVGTVIESRAGTDEAWSAVYGTLGFDVFLFLICVNLIGAVVNRIPIRRHQWAFVVTHASIVMLLIGAWMSRELGHEGVVAIDERAESNTLNLRVSELHVEWGEGQREVLTLERVPSRGALSCAHRRRDHPP